MELKPAVPSGAFRGCSLVWPSVAQGGVAQLAVDLMLETLPLRLCAQADAAGLLLPFAADGPAGALTTAMQIYHSETLRLVVVQQRSDVAMENRDKFRALVLEWIAAQEFEQILVLTGADAVHRIDSQLHGPQIRLLAREDNTVQQAMISRARAANIPMLERRDPTPASPEGVFIPGGGLARPLFYDAVAQNLPLCVLSMFVSEGDNALNAVELATAAALTLGIMDAVTEHASGWKAPETWQALQSSALPAGLY